MLEARKVTEGLRDADTAGRRKRKGRLHAGPFAAPRRLLGWQHLAVSFAGCPMLRC
jgi:hypothetical protein